MNGFNERDRLELLSASGSQRAETSRKPQYCHTRNGVMAKGRGGGVLLWDLLSVFVYCIIYAISGPDVDFSSWKAFIEISN